mmetsp:Transcript_13521/g.40847  ORF Transcript_13521/g.40847 Transcript_13521/m.40847 type:complete len:281 (-) Transcript_13521:131-973(-)
MANHTAGQPSMSASTCRLRSTSSPTANCTVVKRARPGSSKPVSPSPRAYSGGSAEHTSSDPHVADSLVHDLSGRTKMRDPVPSAGSMAHALSTVPRKAMRPAAQKTSTIMAVRATDALTISKLRSTASIVRITPEKRRSTRSARMARKMRIARAVWSTFRSPASVTAFSSAMSAQEARTMAASRRVQPSAAATFGPRPNTRRRISRVKITVKMRFASARRDGSTTWCSGTGVSRASSTMLATMTIATSVLNAVEARMRRARCFTDVDKASRRLCRMGPSR